MQVFLSVGRVCTDEQKLFIEKVEERLRVSGLEPKTIGRNTFTSGQPLETIRETMADCSAILVLAFERTRISEGVELRGKGRENLLFRNRLLSTPWHHIELAMANMLGLPTLVVLEEGLHEEGLLEDKYGWFMLRTRIDAASLDEPEFVGCFGDWVVRAKLPPPKILPDVQSLTVGGILSGLKASQLWAAFGAVAVLMGGAFASGSYLPRLSKSNSVPIAAVAARKVGVDEEVRSFLESLDEDSPKPALVFGEAKKYVRQIIENAQTISSIEAGLAELANREGTMDPQVRKGNHAVALIYALGLEKDSKRREEFLRMRLPSSRKRASAP